MTDERQTGETVRGLSEVRTRIATACRTAGRSEDSVRLVAIAKGHAPEAIRAAHSAGQRDFGESYMQELAVKASALADLTEIRWRFVGHLQHNKAKDAARIGCAIDSVDSERLAAALDKRAQAMGHPLDAMIQVNLAGEEQKAGCAVAEVARLAESVRAMRYLKLVGLMTIPPAAGDPELSRPWFRGLRQLAEKLSLNEISMGMSDDLEVAIQEGATMVRVGAAIFGPRLRP
jgi:hypothetical protein